MLSAVKVAVIKEYNRRSIIVGDDSVDAATIRPQIAIWSVEPIENWFDQFSQNFLNSLQLVEEFNIYSICVLLF
jgi:hypothetical protein